MPCPDTLDSPLPGVPNAQHQFFLRLWQSGLTPPLWSRHFRRAALGQFRSRPILRIGVSTSFLIYATTKHRLRILDQSNPSGYTGDTAVSTQGHEPLFTT